MKAKILKHTGLTEKQFYAKYKTQEDFENSKEGKAFLKAQNSAVLQNNLRTDSNNNGIPDYLELNSVLPKPPIDMSDPQAPMFQNAGPQNNWNFGGNNVSSTPSFGVPSVQQMASNALQPPADPFAMQNYGQKFVQNNPLPANDPNSRFSNGVFQIDKSVTGGLGTKDYKGKGSGQDFNMQGFGNVFTGLVGGIRKFKEQKELTKKLKTWADVSDVIKDAKISNAFAEKPKNQWFSPDDPRFIHNTGEQYLQQGRGTDILSSQNGSMIGGNPTEIQNTYAPEYTLFDDLGYEPLDESENIKAYAGGGGFGSWLGKVNSGLSGSGNTSFMGNVGQGSPLDSFIAGQFGNNAGSQIGGSIGSLFGPLGSLTGTAIGGYLDKQSGKQAFQKSRMAENNDFMNRLDVTTGITGGLNAMGVAENGGYMNPEYNPQVITMFGDHTAEDFADYAHKYRAGGHLKSYTEPSERAMQTYAMGGQLKTHWGGKANTIAYNPYLPGSGEITMLRGASHNNGGIGISYGGSEDGYEGIAANGANMGAQIEAETGEPIIEMASGGSIDSNTGKPSTEAVVFGNIPFTEKLAKATGDQALIDLAKEKNGKTYKKIIADLAKPQNKANKTKLRASELANDADNTKIGKLLLSTAKVMDDGAELTQKGYADLTMKLANLQNATQEIKKEQSYLRGKNISAEALGEGKVENDYDPITKDAELENPYARHGAYLRKAQTGFVEGLGVDSEGYSPYAYEASNIVANNKPLRTFSMGDYGNKWERSIYPEGVALDTYRGDVINMPYKEAFIPDDYTVIDQTPNNSESYVQTYPDGHTWRYTVNGNQRTVDVNGKFYENEYRSSEDPNVWISKKLKDEEDARIAKKAAANNKNKSVGKGNQAPTTTSSNTTSAPTSTDDSNYVSKYGLVPWEGNISKGNKYGKATASSFTAKEWDAIADRLGFKGKGNAEFQKFLLENKESAPFIKARHQKLYGQDPMLDEKLGFGWAAGELLSPLQLTPEIPTDDTTAQQSKEEPKETKVIPYERNKLVDIANILRPLVRNRFPFEFDPRQLAGEYVSIAQNQYEPVPLQEYTTELDPLYRVSYQDVRDQNTADFRDVQRQLGYNPAALAGLLSKKYLANNAVNAEEFRTNQAIEDKIFGGNRAKINQERMANIQLRADQMNKQEAAKSKTKETQQAAISSIADKYLQFDAMKNKYLVQSNLFPQFGYDQGYNIQNQGPWYQPNIPQITGDKGTLKQVPVYGADGKTIEYYKLVPNDSTSETAITKSGGKIAKNNRNSSIVKAIKNL